MTTFCQQCGNQLRSGGKFCQTCGAPSQPSQVAQPTNYQDEYQGNYQGEYQGHYAQPSPYQSPAAYEGYVPYPPPPPSSTNWFKILFITLVVIIALVGVSVIGVVYFVRRAVNDIVKVEDGKDGRPEVSINVPGGAQVKAGTEVTEEELGLPIYPGAVQTKDGSVSISGTEAGKYGQFNVANFTTEDDVDDVVTFYRDKIGEGAQIADTRQDGKRSVVFNTQREQGWRMVTVQEDDEGKTKITIASIQGRTAQ